MNEQITNALFDFLKPLALVAACVVGIILLIIVLSIIHERRQARRLRALERQVGQLNKHAQRQRVNPAARAFGIVLLIAAAGVALVVILRIVLPHGAGDLSDAAGLGEEVGAGNNDEPEDSAAASDDSAEETDTLEDGSVPYAPEADTEGGVISVIVHGSEIWYGNARLSGADQLYERLSGSGVATGDAISLTDDYAEADIYHDVKDALDRSGVSYTEKMTE